MRKHALMAACGFCNENISININIAQCAPSKSKRKILKMMTKPLVRSFKEPGGFRGIIARAGAVVWFLDGKD
jgi:arginyl-tRNA--protein-N-Asp/Glu arginylyltransferase